MFAVLLLVGLASIAMGSDPEVLRADTEPVIVRNAEHKSETSELALTVSGLGADFGRIAVETGDGAPLDCARDATEATKVVCRVDAGAGRRVVVVERTAASGEVEARHSFEWTYTAPMVMSLSGGEEGVPLIVAGRHFGPKDAALAAGIANSAVHVFVGPFAAHSPESPCFVADEAGTKIQCGALPLGFGTGLHVTVCVAGVCGVSEHPLFNFPEPVIESMHVVDGRLHVFGSGFGPLIGAEAAHLVDESAPAFSVKIGERECANPEIVVPGREISCDAEDDLFVGGAADVHRIVLQRRDLRATVSAQHHLTKRQTVDRVVPNNGPTTGDFSFTLIGTAFGDVGSPVLILFRDQDGATRQAINCVSVTLDGTTAECEAAPAFAGLSIDVLVTDVFGQVLDECDGCFSYNAPAVSSASRPSTRGGKVTVRGANFGPSFVEKTVTLVIDGEEHDCEISLATHDRIQCEAPAGAGDHHSVEVTVGGQTTAPNNAFGYRRPDIESATRPHWRGGHVYIRGSNFGTDDDAVTVYIDGEECTQAEVVGHHVRIRCKAPPGQVDGKEHDLKVRVSGQSSSKGGHGYHHLQYTNTPPQFEPHSGHFMAVAGDPLKIRLPAFDADGDEIYYRAHGLPEGATWAQGFGYMQIEYDVPGHLIEYPHTEVNVTMAATVTDGPGHTTEMVTVLARACPAHMDACKDQSCAPRSEMCGTCPISDVVRCSKRRPILNPATGSCHAVDEIDSVHLSVCEISPAGYSFAVGETARLPLFGEEHREAGALLVEAKKGLHAAPGAQPHDGALACVEVRQCNADVEAPGMAASHSVHIESSGMYGPSGVQLLLPTFEDHQQDGYGLCLGYWDCERKEWHCADESLRQHGSALGGHVHKDGCYVLMRDNCPDHHNPMQTDVDMDGAGDLCQGGATGCVDCHSFDELNRKFLRKYMPEARSFDADECAKNQCPTIIVTEEGDRFDAREL